MVFSRIRRTGVTAECVTCGSAELGPRGWGGGRAGCGCALRVAPACRRRHVAPLRRRGKVRALPRRGELRAAQSPALGAAAAPHRPALPSPSPSAAEPGREGGSGGGGGGRVVFSPLGVCPPPFHRKGGRAAAACPAGSAPAWRGLLAVVLEPFQVLPAPSAEELRSSAKLVAPLGCLVSRQKHTLPDLPYDYAALEPHINAQIMQLHHSKHHATYVNNLNVVEEKYKEALAKGDVTTQVSLQPALKFNGGGHINHTIFWTNLSPNGGGEPKGELMEAIKRDFGSFANFKEKLTAVSVGVQGSGWGWLGYNKEQGRLQIAACANQDPLQGTTGLIPLLGIDVWEHAYYLQYKNVRPDYLKAIWNVISWENVSSRYAACKK